MIMIILVLLGFFQSLQVVDGRCLDLNRACTTYARRGYCKKRSSPALYNWTNRNCKLSCQTCVAPKKRDEDLEKIIDKITAAGSALYLVGPKQCGDFMSKCRRYRSLGYCYHPTIRKYCKVSCKLCYPKRSIPIYWNCKDTKPECKLFAYERKCNNGIKTDKLFGRRYCRFSCGYCRRPRTIKCGQPKLQAGTSIVGGKITKHGLFPWQVAIYFDGELRCGGSLFSDRYILTAAHCFYGALDQLQLLKVVLGEHDREKFEGKEQQLSVQRVMLHEDYNSDTQQNDIALLELDRLADLSDHIDMVCLPSENEELKTGKNCTVTGWGNVFNMADQSRILQKISVPVVDKTVCKERNRIGQLSVTDNMICTGYSDGMHIQSACKGDSGGPLSCMDENGISKVYGIVSWGSSQCNALEHFNVFTKVSKYIPWIQKQLGIAMS